MIGTIKGVFALTERPFSDPLSLSPWHSADYGRR